MKSLFNFKILVGDYIETGEFQSIRARHGTTKTTAIKPQQYNQSNTATTSNCTCAPTIQNSQIADSIMSQVKAFIEKAINVADQKMPVEYPHQRTE